MLVAVTLLGSCQSVPQGSGPASAARAERLVRQGSHAEAARMYEDLAEANVAPARDEFARAATRAWLDANRADDAQHADVDLGVRRVPEVVLAQRRAGGDDADGPQERLRHDGGR